MTAQLADDHVRIVSQVACCICSLWEGIKDNAQTYCMIGAGVGAGEHLSQNSIIP